MAKGNWRDDLDRRLLRLLKTDGVNAFLRMAVDMLNVDASGDGQLKAQFVGEVCEVVLFGLTSEYLKRSGKEAKVFHSTVLKDLKNPNSDFVTELDMTIVSPSFILTTECKSYSGRVSIKDRCTLCKPGREFDVYKQSKLHHDKLYLYGEQLALPGLGITRVPVFANVFLFSDSDVFDLREDSNKKSIRVLTTSTLFDYYDALFKQYPKQVFDYDRACRVFKNASSARWHKVHAEYVGY